MADEKDFKVVDRRFSAGGKDEKQSETPPPKQGEGFTMKEGRSDVQHEVDFSTFVLSLATGALINMGLAPDPMTKKVQKNLELARQNIDILGLLELKTKGNLTPEEAQLMENILAEIRLRFVDASK